MRKLILLVLSVLLGILGGFVAIGQVQAAGDDPIVLKLGHKTAVGGTFDQQAHKFKELVEARTGGKIQIDIYPANQLGKQRDQVTGVSMGSQEMFMEAVTTLATFNKDMRFFAAPFMFENVDQMLDSPAFKEVLEEVRRKNNIRVLAVKGSRPSFHIWTRKKPITSLDDLRGLKLRVPPSKVQVDLWNGMGATAVSVPWSEVYVALAQGVVDGMVHNVVQIVDEKFYEQLKYVTLVYASSWGATNGMMINERTYQSLSPEFQKILVESAMEAGTFFDELMKKELDASWDTVKRAGIEVIKIDTKPWYQKAHEIHKKLEESGEWSKGLLARKGS